MKSKLANIEHPTPRSGASIEFIPPWRDVQHRSPDHTSPFNIEYSIFIIFLTLTACLFPLRALAQAPGFINYQGRLVSGTNLFNGPVGLSLRLYNAPSGGALLYEDSNTVTVVDGLYSTFIGDQTNAGSLASALAGTNLHLAISIDGGAELTPRERVAGVAYALVAAGVPPGAITSLMLADGAVNSAKIADGSISNVDVSINAAIAASKIANTALTHITIFGGDVSGVFTNLQLAANSVGAAEIAAGAVNTSELAAGAVGFSQLARSYLAGTVNLPLPAGGLDTNFDVAFAPAFDSTPLVTLALHLDDFPSDLDSRLIVTARATTGFAARATISFTASSSTQVVVDATGNVGQYASMAIVAGNPAMSYYDASANQVKYVRALDTNGATWGTPVPLLSGGGSGTSLAVVDGRPAIAHANFSIGFIRALDATGAVWGANVPVDAAFGVSPSLAVLGGAPAIAYQDGASNDLRFCRALDSTGGVWAAPMVLDANNETGFTPSLNVVNGNPSISYYLFGTRLRYIRANDSTGGVWNAPVNVSALDGSGWYSSLDVVSGNPAISCYSGGAGQDVFYFRANDATGGTWSAAVTVDTNGIAGFLGTSLEVINGRPAISYQDGTRLKYAHALDGTGSAWGAPMVVDTNAGTGEYSTLLQVNGLPAIGYYDSINANLKYSRFVEDLNASVNWIAVEP